MMMMGADSGQRRMALMGVLVWSVVAVLCWCSQMQEVACDADPLYDFGVEGVIPRARDLVFRGYRKIPGKNFAEAAANVDTWKILKGLGVATRRLVFPPCGQVSPHTHPRGTELCHVLKGTLHVGLTDNDNRVYHNKLEEGDATVFPRGLMHWMQNFGTTETIALCSLNSANPGYNLLNVQLFGKNAGIPSVVLQSAFRMSAADVLKTQQNTPLDDDYPRSGCVPGVAPFAQEETSMTLEQEDDNISTNFVREVMLP